MRVQIVTGSLLAGLFLFAADARDPKAVEIAQDIQKAMGGQEAWNAARFVRFDFKVNIGGETRPTAATSGISRPAVIAWIRKWIRRWTIRTGSC